MNEQLQEGIRAAKAGDRETARTLLLRVVTEEEENEQAWLWLSGVMETWEERRICLENVLTLNPDNEVAQRGLAKLNALAPRDETALLHQQTVKNVSPAAAILYPERHLQSSEENFLPEEAAAFQPPPVVFTHNSTYQDVWTSGQTMCAFCANPVDEDDRRCTKCKKSLVGWRHRYPQPTAQLYPYLVVLCGLTIFMTVDFFLDISLQNDTWLLVLHGLTSLVLMSMIVAAYVRHLWGHYGVILLAFTIILVNGNLLYRLLQNTPFAGVTELDIGFLIAVSIALKMMQMLAALVVLGLAVFSVGSEFDRRKMHFVVQLDKKARDATQFHATARLLAGEGMWASAVLHWEHAAAHAPNHAQYQRELGAAYARLGFYERSLDALQSALRLANNPDVKAEIVSLLDEVNAKKTGQTQNK